MSSTASPAVSTCPCPRALPPRPRGHDPARWARPSLILMLASVLVACSTPQTRIEALAIAHGLEPLVLTGGEFELRAYFKPSSTGDRALRVYLEGDGTPWIGRGRVSSDPTPRHPLALRLMIADPDPALYLGRPCYHDRVDAGPCRPALWTQARYSSLVVESMAAALRSFVIAHDVERLTLIGYSGGGVLAWLLAERLPDVDRLVTIAANLDIDAWTDRHGYSRLTHSLNPATGPPLPDGIEQIHLVGSRDTNVPVEILASLPMQASTRAAILVLEADHGCCWDTMWPTLLARLDALAFSEPGSLVSATGRNTPRPSTSRSADPISR